MLGVVTWRDEQRNACVVQHQASATVIHLSSRIHQQLMHQLPSDSLAPGGRLELLVERSHLWYCRGWSLPWGLILWQWSGWEHCFLLVIWIPAVSWQPPRTVPAKALKQKENTGHRYPHQQKELERVHRTVLGAHLPGHAYTPAPAKARGLQGKWVESVELY